MPDVEGESDERLTVVPDHPAEDRRRVEGLSTLRIGLGRRWDERAPDPRQRADRKETSPEL